MSDKIQRSPIEEEYILAKVDVNGSTHIGVLIEGVCFQMCNYAQNPILLPVLDGEVECLQCIRIMKAKNITINMSVKYVNSNKITSESKVTLCLQK